MRVLLQRVSSAAVTVAGSEVGSIDHGLLVLAGVRTGDLADDVEWIAGKIAGLRIFPDAGGRMNLSVKEAGGAVLLVSQFTLYGDVRKGRRPSFDAAARPEEAVRRLDELKRHLEAEGLRVATGEFGAHMTVSLVNDGPVTLMLDSAERGRGAVRVDEAPAPASSGGATPGSPGADAPPAPPGGAPAPSRGATGELPPVPSGRLRLLGPDSPLGGVALVLASASPRRRDLLRELGLSFTMSPTELDESRDVPPEPEARARVLAERKAQVCAAKFQECLVLAADTIVAVDGQPLGKPGDAADALRMLGMLAGREHRVVTGVCVAHAARQLFRTQVVSTLVRFRDVPEEELRRYVATGEPFGKAGAYAIQGIGGLLVAGIEGDYSNVVGLPLGATLDLLEGIVGVERTGAPPR